MRSSRLRRTKEDALLQTCLASISTVGRGREDRPRSHGIPNQTDSFSFTNQS